MSKTSRGRGKDRPCLQKNSETTAQNARGRRAPGTPVPQDATCEMQRRHRDPEEPVFPPRSGPAARFPPGACLPSMNRASAVCPAPGTQTGAEQGLWLWGACGHWETAGFRRDGRVSGREPPPCAPGVGRSLQKQPVQEAAPRWCHMQPGSLTGGSDECGQASRRQTR